MKPEISQKKKSSEKCQKWNPQVQQYCKQILAAAKETELSPDLIAAVITQESGGQEDTMSSSGAVGLMQVMPCDGLASEFICINGPCFASRPTIEELKDPEFNIKFGSRMLASLVKKYGNTRDALKGYGPMGCGYYYADIVLGIYNQIK